MPSLSAQTIRAEKGPFFKSFFSRVGNLCREQFPAAPTCRSRFSVAFRRFDFDFLLIRQGGERL
jgi:hypothetical protein